MQRIENPYFEEVIKEGSLVKKSRLRRKAGNIKILYVSEPTRNHALKYYNDTHYWGYTEYEIMNDLLKIIDSCRDCSIELKVRLHPAERNNKYTRFKKIEAYL